MRLLLAPVLAVGTLAGCQTLTQPSPVVVDTFREVCQYEPIAYAAFQLYAPRAAPQVVARVNEAHGVVTTLCANPPINIAQAFLRAFTAYMIISGATP